MDTITTYLNSDIYIILYIKTSTSYKIASKIYYL